MLMLSPLKKTHNGVVSGGGVHGGPDVVLELLRDDHLLRQLGQVFQARHLVRRTAQHVAEVARLQVRPQRLKYTKTKKQNVRGKNKQEKTDMGRESERTAKSKSRWMMRLQKTTARNKSVLYY